jgi:hypothetical protein
MNNYRLLIMRQKIEVLYTAQKYTSWLYFAACETKNSYLIK